MANNEEITIDQIKAFIDLNKERADVAELVHALTDLFHAGPVVVVVAQHEVDRPLDDPFDRRQVIHQLLCDRDVARQQDPGRVLFDEALGERDDSLLVTPEEVEVNVGGPGIVRHALILRHAGRCVHERSTQVKGVDPLAIKIPDLHPLFVQAALATPSCCDGGSRNALFHPKVSKRLLQLADVSRWRLERVEDHVNIVIAGSLSDDASRQCHTKSGRPRNR